MLATGAWMMWKLGAAPWGRLATPCLLSCCAIINTAAMAQTPAALPWVVVQPTQAAHYKVDVVKLFTAHLAKELEGGITVHEATRDLGPPALAWSLSQAPQRRSIILMTEELTLMGPAAKNSAQHVSHFTPLLVVLQTRWCLFVPKDSALRRPEQLLDWAINKDQPPRVALPVASGRLRLWVQGMAVRTQRPWEMMVYGIGGDMRHALQNGADAALGRCDLQWRNADVTRILAKGSGHKEGFLPQTALFTDLGWMPLGDGWLAWMAPRSLPQAERDAMAQKLHAIASKPQVQWQLEASDQVVAHMSPEDSARYLNTFTTTWSDIGQLLLGRDFGDSSKMQGLAVP